MKLHVQNGRITMECDLLVDSTYHSKIKVENCVITTKYRMKCIVCWFYHLEKVTNNCLNEFTIRFSRKLITKIRKIPAMFLERL